MDAEIDGVPFGELMSQAAKLKTHQAKPDRRNFDSYPKFKQNSMFQRDEILAARALPFPERLAAAKTFKAEADNHFRGGRLLDASVRYEHALAVFRYLENQDPGWKKKGIRDEDISVHDYEAAPEEQDALRGLYTACYLNLARVYHKQSDTATAVSACSFCLDVDPDCDKALLLRAQVRLAPASAGAVEHEEGTRDTSAALAILERKCQAMDKETTTGGQEGRQDLEKRRREVKKYLRGLRTEAKEQKEKDKQWDGVFTRGEIYSGSRPPPAAGASGRASGQPSAVGTGGDGKDEVTKDPRQQIDEAIQIAQFCRQQGREDEADKIERDVQQAQERLHQAESGTGAFDFDNPTDEMVEDAKSKGIDLRDPRVRKVLKELQLEKDQKGPLTQEAIDAKFQRDQDEMAAHAKELVQDMSPKECCKALGALGVDVPQAATQPELVDLLVESMMEKTMRGEPLPDFTEERAKAPSFLTARAIAISVFVFVFARLYGSGLIHHLVRTLWREISGDDSPSSNTVFGSNGAAGDGGGTPPHGHLQGDYSSEFDEFGEL